MPAELNIDKCTTINWGKIAALTEKTDKRLLEIREYREHAKAFQSAIEQYDKARANLLKYEKRAVMPIGYTVVLGLKDRDFTKDDAIKTLIRYTKETDKYISLSKRINLYIDQITSDISSHSKYGFNDELSKLKGRQSGFYNIKKDPSGLFTTLLNYDRERLHAAKQIYVKYLESIVKYYTADAVDILNQIEEPSTAKKVWNDIKKPLSFLSGLILPTKVDLTDLSIGNSTEEKRAKVGEKVLEALDTTSKGISKQWEQLKGRQHTTEEEALEIEYRQRSAQIELIKDNFLDLYIYITQYHDEEKDDWDGTVPKYPKIKQAIISELESNRAPIDAFLAEIKEATYVTNKTSWSN